jgi:hypothetical protein
MTPPTDELKTRARLLLNGLQAGEQPALARARLCCERQRWPWPDAGQLQQCLNVVAAECGFAHWDHARRILGGDARAGDDMGSLWHAEGCSHLLNHWFASHDEARSCLASLPGSVLLPYRRQFVVVAAPYLQVLGLRIDDDAWQQVQRDLVAGYGTPAWSRLCARRLAAMRPVAA